MGRLVDALFWLGMVLVTLSGLKMTVLPNTEFHPLGILCLTVACYYIDRTSKPSITIVGVNKTEEMKDENHTN